MDKKLILSTDPKTEWRVIVMKKHTISTDSELNTQLKEEVSTLRGGIMDQADKNKLPARFTVEPHNDSPRMIITDTETSRSVEVPLFSYGEVRKVLNTLFE